ncbi:hypothetical protein [Teichococcus oryzae]|nr:hypothetical protein [Pseudoroseomonas oryzae]
MTEKRPFDALRRDLRVLRWLVALNFVLTLAILTVLASGLAVVP